jgi:hypothetical protein
MKRMFRTVLMTLLVAGASAAAVADDLTSARSAIEAQYARLDAAVTRKDPMPYEGIVTPDWQTKSQKGELEDLATAMKSWQAVRAVLVTVTFRSVIKSAVAEGDTVKITVDSVLEGTLQQPGGGAVTPIRIEGTADDTWVRVGTEWRWQRNVDVSSKTWIDGKLMQ